MIIVRTKGVSGLDLGSANDDPDASCDKCYNLDQYCLNILPDLMRFHSALSISGQNEEKK